MCYMHVYLCMLCCNVLHACVCTCACCVVMCYMHGYLCMPYCYVLHACVHVYAMWLCVTCMCTCICYVVMCYMHVYVCMLCRYVLHPCVQVYAMSLCCICIFACVCYVAMLYMHVYMFMPCRYLFHVYASVYVRTIGCHEMYRNERLHVKENKFFLHIQQGSQSKERQNVNISRLFVAGQTLNSLSFSWIQQTFWAKGKELSHLPLVWAHRFKHTYAGRPWKLCQRIIQKLSMTLTVGLQSQQRNLTGPAITSQRQLQ